MSIFPLELQDVSIFATGADGVTPVRLGTSLAVLWRSFQFVRSMKNFWGSNADKTKEIDLTEFSEKTVAIVIEIAELGITDRIKGLLNWPAKPTLDIHELVYALDKLQPIGMDRIRLKILRSFVHEIATISDYHVAVNLIPAKKGGHNLVSPRGSDNKKDELRHVAVSYLIKILKTTTDNIIVDTNLLLELSEYFDFWENLIEYSNTIILNLDFAVVLKNIKDRTRLSAIFDWYFKGRLSRNEKIPQEIYRLYVESLVFPRYQKQSNFVIQSLERSIPVTVFIGPNIIHASDFDYTDTDNFILIASNVDYPSGNDDKPAEAVDHRPSVEDVD